MTERNYQLAVVECYTYDMGVGEAGAKDSLINLFENMPAEAVHNSPLDKPLSAEERRSATEWLLSPDGGGVSLRLKPPYNNPELQDRLIENLLLNSWFLPDTTLGNRIPLQAGSGHKVGSSTIPLNLAEEPTPRRVDVVVKPFSQKHSKAESELNKLNEIRQRGINAVEPLGVLDINDAYGHDTYLLTILKKGIVPLQKVNLEELDVNQKFTQLQDLLKGLATFVAAMHNKGVAHQDLHLGNIAVDITQNSPDEFVVFDLEKTTIIPKDRLGVKNKYQTEAPADYMKKFKEFERLTLKDVANVAAEIAGRNPHISYDVILHNFVINYLRSRARSHGKPQDNDFMAAFDQSYKKLVPRIAQSVEFRRSKIEEQLLATANEPKSS